MSWLKKLFSKKPPPAPPAGDGGSPWGPPKTAGAQPGAKPGAPGAPESPSRGGKADPWVAVFRSIKNPAEQGKVDAFVEGLMQPEQRKLFNAKKLGDLKEGVRQVSLDPKLVPADELESIGSEWFKRLAKQVKPALAPGDYWGVSFLDQTGAQRQFLMTPTAGGGLEPKHIRSAPGDKPVTEPLSLAGA